MTPTVQCLLWCFLDLLGLRGGTEGWKGGGGEKGEESEGEGGGGGRRIGNGALISFQILQIQKRTWKETSKKRIIGGGTWFVF